MIVLSFCSGFEEKDFERVADFFDRSVSIAIKIKASTGSKIKDFKAALENGPAAYPELVALGEEVREFSRSFPTVGY